MQRRVYILCATRQTRSSNCLAPDLHHHHCFSPLFPTVIGSSHNLNWFATWTITSVPTRRHSTRRQHTMFASFQTVMSQNKLPLSSPSSQASGSQRAQPPPSKRRRISESSLSDAEDDDNDASEEDQPLAARISNLSPSMARVPVENGRTPASSAVGAKGNGNGAGRRGGKTSGMKFKAHTAPTSIAPPTGEVQAEMNGEIQPINGHETAIKVEDRLDEGQLDRLATGVTVDTADSATTTAVSVPLCLHALPLQSTPFSFRVE